MTASPPPPGPGDDAPPPRVTPYFLRIATEGCPRRLDRALRAEPGQPDPVPRARIRDAFLAAARAAHAQAPRVGDAAWPAPPAHLRPEEARVVEQAGHWYRTLFGDRTVTLHDHGLERPSEVAGIDARIGGWVDLVARDADGRPEIRQVAFGAPTPPARPLDHWSVRAAVVRLADWIGTGPLVVSWTDLLRGARVEAVHDGPTVVAACHDGIVARLAELRVRTADPRAERGSECTMCAHRKGCPEFPRAMIVRTHRDSLVPGVLTLTPSAVEAWSRCRRLWQDQYLLQIPASDEGPPAVHGQRVHDLLRRLHDDGPCDDPVRIDEIVDLHGGQARVRAELTDHARRCPIGAESFGHEVTLVRLQPRRPNFIASARLDAVWIHDGVLDVRDYKTGGVATTRVADDPRARVQAWVAEPTAAAEGLGLRIRYEHLAAEIVEDPEEWAPEADDIDAVGDWLAGIATAMRTDEALPGVADPVVCRGCRYRSICPDSATPGEPAWPRVDPDDLDDPDDAERP